MAETKQPTLFTFEKSQQDGESSDAEVKNTAGRRAKKPKEPLTSKQQLSSTIKSVRDLLRKDAGLSGDTDRLPQLTWLLFLKSLDDAELAHEEMLGEIYEPTIEPPYRWRDWAAVADQRERETGDMLLEFVNGKLFPYLSQLAGDDARSLPT